MLYIYLTSHFTALYTYQHVCNFYFNSLSNHFDGTKSKIFQVELLVFLYKMFLNVRKIIPMEFTQEPQENLFIYALDIFREIS